MKEVRLYQRRGVDDLRTAYAAGYRRVVYQAPTGSGKTALFSAVVDGATARGNRTLILGHHQEIVDQIDEALTDLGLEHGFIAAGYPEDLDAAVQIASVATLVRRLGRLGDIDLIVVDEAHHAVAGMWRKILGVDEAETGGELGKALARKKPAILGVTASPERLDGKGLDEIFDHLVIGPSSGSAP